MVQWHISSLQFHLLIKSGKKWKLFLSLQRRLEETAEEHSKGRYQDNKRTVYWGFDSQKQGSCIGSQEFHFSSDADLARGPWAIHACNLWHSGWLSISDPRVCNCLWLVAAVTGVQWFFCTSCFGSHQRYNRKYASKENEIFKISCKQITLWIFLMNCNPYFKSVQVFQSFQRTVKYTPRAVERQ